MQKKKSLKNYVMMIKFSCKTEGLGKELKQNQRVT